MPGRPEIQKPSPSFPTQQRDAYLLGYSPCISLKYLPLAFQNKTLLNNGQYISAVIGHPSSGQKAEKMLAFVDLTSEI